MADGDSTVGTAVSQCGRATPVNSLRGTPARGEGGAVRVRGVNALAVGVNDGLTGRS
ncbi:hypothetical protein GCM10010215_47750 [Streptomyces virginiae]|uniref:Uncharacterized protein n=1 Tax=Streptomyces virginiae TaxID=1961 RepID=A0ABQ3NXL9_STRVG|nr:hypothetical protein GCM10010215_47750 [Streptomyces virginiae]GHI17517.1 hypothetical protein Scinn_69800 [Streptomyces virginiae]